MVVEVSTVSCNYVMLLLFFLTRNNYPQGIEIEKAYIVSAYLYEQAIFVKKGRIMIIGLGQVIRQIFKKSSFISWRSLVVSHRALFLDLFG